MDNVLSNTVERLSRKAVVLLAAAVCLQALMLPAQAQVYPAKSVRIIVPFAPGGSADGAARPIADRLGTVLGQTFIVENRPGGAATIGAALVAKADPDGYTLLLIPGTHVLATRMLKTVPFHPFNDFTPISNVVFVPNFIVADKRLPFTTMKEMVQYAKANPGKLTLGISDVSGRIAGHVVAQEGNIDLPSITYKGGAPIISDVAGGHLPLGVGSQVSVMPFYKDKRVTVLGATSPKRLPTMPDVPTIGEALGIADFDHQTWFALAGPAGLPAPIVDRLQRAVAQVLAEPELRERLHNLGMIPAEDTTAAGLAALMKRHFEKNAKLMDAAGIKPE